jgi:Protein of unknown function (DUF4238)
MAARKHHYVPQCYLKLFSVSHKKIPQLTVFDRERKKMFKAGIDNVAAQRDFNAIDVEGMDADAFEKSMSAFEGELAEALQRIVSTRSLANQEDRAYLLNLVGLTAMRNPRLRETMRAGHEQAARMMMDQVLATKERYEHQMRKIKEAGRLPEKNKVSYEEMKRFFEGGQYEVTLDNTFQVGQEMRVFDKILPLIFQRGWILLRAPEHSAGFITSDHPFCLFWSDPKQRGGFYPPGLGLRGTEITFTISPRLALVGAFEFKNDEVDVSEDSVAGINGGVIALAEAQVYARDQNFHYAMQPDEPLQKASKLITDKRFLRPKETEEE